MPPVNIDRANAINITVLPYEVTQVVGDATDTYTVWYKTTIPADTCTMGCNVWNTIYPFVSGYKPYVNVWKELVHVIGDEVAQFPVEPGVTYYFEIVRSRAGGTFAPTDQMRFQLYIHEGQQIKAGNIVVQDDETEFPLVFLDENSNYNVRNFVYIPSGGESADVLPDGTVAIEDRSGDTFETYGIAIYDKDYNKIGLAAVNHVIYIRRNVEGTRFWTSYQNSTGNVRKVSYLTKEGVLGTPVSGLTGVTVYGVAPNLGETILYYYDGFPAAIKRWDLVNNMAMSDLAVAVADGNPFDILVLADDTILVLYTQVSTNIPFVRRYNAAGILLNTYNSPQPSISSTFNHIAYALDNPNSFWLWIHTEDATFGEESVFYNIRISDGAVLKTVISPEFTTGSYDGAISGNPPHFGNAFSCTFYIQPVDSGGGCAYEEEPPPEPEPTPLMTGGLLVINPSSPAPTRHDDYYTQDSPIPTFLLVSTKIPTPRIRTALLGD